MEVERLFIGGTWGLCADTKFFHNTQRPVYHLFTYPLRYRNPDGAMQRPARPIIKGTVVGGKLDLDTTARINGIGIVRIELVPGRCPGTTHAVLVLHRLKVYGVVLMHTERPRRCTWYHLRHLRLRFMHVPRKLGRRVSSLHRLLQ